MLVDKIPIHNPEESRGPSIFAKAIHICNALKTVAMVILCPKYHYPKLRKNIYMYNMIDIYICHCVCAYLFVQRIYLINRPIYASWRFRYFAFMAITLMEYMDVCKLTSRNLGIFNGIQQSLFALSAWCLPGLGTTLHRSLVCCSLYLY